MDNGDGDDFYDENPDDDELNYNTCLNCGEKMSLTAQLCFYCTR